MAKVVVNIEFFALFQNVVGGPSCVDLSTENRDQVAAAGNLAGGDD